MHTITYSENIFPVSSSWFEQAKVNQPAPQPLSAGSPAPEFSVHTLSGIWSDLSNHIAQANRISLNELLAYRPLVISFYNPHTRDYGHQQIESLKNLYTKIRALGGELVVFTAESLENIDLIASHYQIPFNLVQDAGNRIASQFGLFSAAHPVWEKVVGIDENVALPGTYVIASGGHITYAFVDTDFTQPLPVRPLLTAVYSASDNRIKKVA